MKKLLLTLSTLSLINGADPFPNNDPQYDEDCRIDAALEKICESLEEISESRKSIHNFREANLDALLGDTRIERERTPHELALERFYNSPEDSKQTTIEYICPIWIKRYYINGVLVTLETIF